jgi:DNA-binding GntR family transcriptional regulator
VFEISQLVPVAAEVVELANREHDRLIAAIARHDEQAATAAMVAHIESTHALWLGLGRVPRTGTSSNSRERGR